MKPRETQRGFSLVELLVAASVFTFVMISVSQLFAQAMDLQRRASGYQKIQENALFVLESIAREVRVSEVLGTSGCASSLRIEHPVNGTVVYSLETDATGQIGTITRSSTTQGGGARPITSEDVSVTKLSFCVSGAEIDNQQARVTIPVTFQAVSGKAVGRVAVSLQTTVVSRDLIEELTN